MTLLAEMMVARDGFELDASLRIEAGETLSLVGPNGAGKSTIAAVLSGEVGLGRGRITLGGRVLDDGASRLAAQARGVGVVFQDRLLFAGMSVRENVAFGVRASGVGRREALGRADAWLERVGVQGLAGRKSAQLSGGEAQRVALARALAVEPELLILDEPFAALDAPGRAGIRRLLAEELGRFEGVTLLITHDPVESLTLADRVAVLIDGRVSQVGEPGEIRSAPRSEYAATFVGVNLLTGAVRRDGDRWLVDTEAPGAGASIRIASSDIADGTSVFACLHPHAVTLSLAEPEGSARNVFRGRVEVVEDLDGRVRVSLSTPAPITAEITPEARGRLGIEPGREIWASFKATEVAVYPR